MEKRYGRFNDLKAAGIVSNWTTLQRWIREYGFPPPMKPGGNTSIFDLDAVADWLKAHRDDSRAA